MNPFESYVVLFGVLAQAAVLTWAIKQGFQWWDERKER